MDMEIQSEQIPQQQRYTAQMESQMESQMDVHHNMHLQVNDISNAVLNFAPPVDLGNDEHESKVGELNGLFDLDDVQLSDKCARLPENPVVVDPYSNVAYDFETEPIPLKAPVRLA